ncbi:MAG: hypothetical protein ACYCOU_23315, partial [Sulfobacillus sp.]
RDHRLRRRECKDIYGRHVDAELPDNFEEVRRRNLQEDLWKRYNKWCIVSWKPGQELVLSDNPYGIYVVKHPGETSYWLYDDDAESGKCATILP